VSGLTNEHVPFSTSSGHYGIHPLRLFNPSHVVAYEVVTMRLDDSLEELKAKNVTLMRMDTEGTDFSAFKGFYFQKCQLELISD